MIDDESSLILVFTQMIDMNTIHSLNSDKTSVDLCMPYENNAHRLIKQPSPPTDLFFATLVQSVHCARIPEQYRWPLLPYQDPPGLGYAENARVAWF